MAPRVHTHRRSRAESPAMFERLEGRTLFALVAPLNVHAAAVATEQVTVTWADNNGEETGYRVQRKLSTEQDSAFVTLTAGVNTLPANTTLYADKTATTVGTTYVYRVVAVDAVGEGPVSATAQATPSAETATDLVLTGSATVLPGADNDPATAADNIIQLTSNKVNETGGVFTGNAQPVTNPNIDRIISSGSTKITGFTSSFEFTVPAKSDTPAEGFAFVIQRDGAKALGAGANGLGYQGLGDSFAVKFDYFDGDFEQNINQTGPYAGGLMDDFGLDTNFDFTSGHTYRVELEYIKALTRLQERITDLSPTNPDTTQTYTFTQVQDAEGAVLDLDLDDVLDGKKAFFGFTGSTGAADQTSTQQIANFKVNGVAVGAAVTTPPSPTITDLYVSGSTWRPTFKTALGKQAFGDATFGYHVTTDVAAKPIDWTNVDTVTVKFATPATAQQVTPALFSLVGVRATYTASAVAVAADGLSASFTLDRAIGLIAGKPAGGDRLKLKITGLAAAGADFTQNLVSLPGDVNQSGGGVNAPDLVLVRNRIGLTATSPGTGANIYGVLFDVNGDGVINATDSVNVRNRIGTPAVPAAPPALVFSGTRIAPAARKGLIQDFDLLA